MPTRIVTVSELKIKMSALMTELQKQEISLYITQHGKPEAVLMRYDDYEAMLKKLDDLEDLLMMKDSLSAPEEESIKLSDWK